MKLFEEFHLDNDALIKTEIPGPRSNELINQQLEFEGKGISYPNTFPMGINRAKGAIIEDVDGNRFIDFFSGCGVLNVGHCNQEVLEAVEKQQQKLIHALDFPTENKSSFVRNLLNELPEHIRDDYKLMFCASTGADAIEAAVKLAKLKTGRDTILAFQGGYHGVTAGTMALTGYQKHRGPITSYMPGVHFIPYSYCYRCPVKKSQDSCDMDCTDFFANVLTNPYSGVPKPAAIVIEPIQGEGGTIVPKDGYIQKLIRLAEENDVVVILDEIQCGFYRTGNFLESIDLDVAPDIITLSKGLGGIGFPLSAILYKKEMDVWTSGYHVGTFRGNQVSVAAGNAALSFISKYDVKSHTREMSDYLKERLEDLTDSFEVIGDIRGKGLFIGIEFVQDRETKSPFAEYVSKLRDVCFKKGLLFEVGGHYDNVVRFLPPLIVNKEIMDNALRIFTEALFEVNELLCPERVELLEESNL